MANNSNSVLRTICWNINGGLKNKLVTTEFVTYICDFDLIMLTECWIGNEFMYELPGYKCFPFPRKLSSSTQGGGIVIFIKDTMSKSIEVVQNYADSVIWLKTNFATGSCMYIACVYIPPANSKFYAKYDCNIFNDLENQISYYKNIGKVAIVGDFNARTADRNDYIESDSTSEVVSNCDLFTYIPDAIMPDRTNVNEYGLKLISMCKSSGLRIQNGRWEKTHDFTFAGSRGRSVVDYLISQEGVLTEEFRIADFTTFSDHTPLEFFSEYYEHFRSLSGTCEENDECNFVLNDNVGI